MSLAAIVKTVGGDLASNGLEAQIPAPGHSKKDRSVSLRLKSDGRVLVHSFGGAQWSEVFDWLRSQGLIDQRNRVTSVAGGSCSNDRDHAPHPPEPNDQERTEVARRIWHGAVPIAGTLAARHFALRHVGEAASQIDPSVVRFRRDTPIAPYHNHPTPYRQPALLAAVRNRSGDLVGVEATYLAPSGRRASNLRANRKTIGPNPPSSAIRLFPAQPSMLVAEGLFTTLSACKYHGRPGWALQSMRNLVTWQPPEGVRDVLIAGDTGPGAKAALTLRDRLLREGLIAKVVLPPAPFGDWNDFDAAFEQARTAAQPDASMRRLLRSVGSVPGFDSLFSPIN